MWSYTVASFLKGKIPFIHMLYVVLLGLPQWNMWSHAVLYFTDDKERGRGVIYWKLFIVRIFGPVLKLGLAWFYLTPFNTSVEFCLSEKFKWVKKLFCGIPWDNQKLSGMSWTKATDGWKIISLTGVPHRTPIQAPPISKFLVWETSYARRLMNWIRIPQFLGQSLPNDFQVHMSTENQSKKF